MQVLCLAVIFLATAPQLRHPRQREPDILVGVVNTWSAEKRPAFLTDFGFVFGFVNDFRADEPIRDEAVAQTTADLELKLNLGIGRPFDTGVKPLNFSTGCD